MLCKQKRWQERIGTNRINIYYTIIFKQLCYMILTDECLKADLVECADQRWLMKHLFITLYFISSHLIFFCSMFSTNFSLCIYFFTRKAASVCLVRCCFSFRRNFPLYFFIDFLFLFNSINCGIISNCVLLRCQKHFELWSSVMRIISRWKVTRIKFKLWFSISAYSVSFAMLHIYMP